MFHYKPKLCTKPNRDGSPWQIQTLQVLQILVDLPDFKEEYRGLARETEGLLDVLEESLAAAAAASSDEEEEEDDYDDDDDGDYCEGLSLYATEGVVAGSSSAQDGAGGGHRR